MNNHAKEICSTTKELLTDEFLDSIKTSRDIESLFTLLGSLEFCELINDESVQDKELETKLSLAIDNIFEAFSEVTKLLDKVKDSVYNLTKE